jgi:hypothetical protein
MKPSSKLAALLDSALAVDSTTLGDFRNVADQTPEERERSEAWRRFWGRPRVRAGRLLKPSGELK